jgi:hypothetical protein
MNAPKQNINNVWMGTAKTVRLRSPWVRQQGYFESGWVNQNLLASLRHGYPHTDMGTSQPHGYGGTTHFNIQNTHLSSTFYRNIFMHTYAQGRTEFKRVGQHAVPCECPAPADAAVVVISKRLKGEPSPPPWRGTTYPVDPLGVVNWIRKFV